MENAHGAMQVNGVPVDEEELYSLILDGRKLDAVRRVMEWTGADLRQAKQAVDQLEQERWGGPTAAERPQNAIRQIWFDGDTLCRIRYDEGEGERDVTPQQAEEWEYITNRYRDMLDALQGNRVAVRQELQPAAAGTSGFHLDEHAQKLLMAAVLILFVLVVIFGVGK